MALTIISTSYPLNFVHQTLREFIRRYCQSKVKPILFANSEYYSEMSVGYIFGQPIVCATQHILLLQFRAPFLCLDEEALALVARPKSLSSPYDSEQPQRIKDKKYNNGLFYTLSLFSLLMIIYVCENLLSVKIELFQQSPLC